jgi:hypothetical protein
MPRPDDSTLTLGQLTRVRQEAERALRQAGTFGIGRLVPINGHRMSRKRQLGHVVKALTAKRILLGAAA